MLITSGLDLTSFEEGDINENGTVASLKEYFLCRVSLSRFLLSPHLCFNTALVLALYVYCDVSLVNLQISMQFDHCKNTVKLAFLAFQKI